MRKSRRRCDGEAEAMVLPRKRSIFELIFVLIPGVSGVSGLGELSGGDGGWRRSELEAEFGLG